MLHRDPPYIALVDTRPRPVLGSLACLIIVLAAYLPIFATSSVAAGTLSTENGATENDAAENGDASHLQKVGEARLKVLLWSIYDARLYTGSGEYSAGERPLRLEVEYLLDIGAAELAERTLEEWESMGRDHPRQEAWTASLADLWPDIQANDVISLELDDNDVSTFLHNGRRLGNIDDPEFGQSFVDIWLSGDSQRPKLRTGLLGQQD
jgi:hypothetical protein